MHACMQTVTYRRTAACSNREERYRERERESDDTNMHNHTHTHTHVPACMRITCICKKLQCARLPLALSENLHVGMRLYLYIHTHNYLRRQTEQSNNARCMPAPNWIIPKLPRNGQCLLLSYECTSCAGRTESATFACLPACLCMYLCLLESNDMLDHSLRSGRLRALAVMVVGLTPVSYMCSYRETTAKRSSQTSYQIAPIPTCKDPFTSSETLAQPSGK